MMLTATVNEYSTNHSVKNCIRICDKKNKYMHQYNVKVVSTTFLLVCFVCLKESTCETRKNVFYFASKAIFVLEIIKFKLFKYSNVMTSSNA